MADKAVHVVAGAIFDSQGRVLIAQRPPGKHMAGGWEFPGGKVEPGESAIDGLIRELREELGIEVLEAEPVIAFTHRYADRSVLLDLWMITRHTGTPSAAEGQALKWEALGNLTCVGLLEADRPMIDPLTEAYKLSSRKRSAVS